MPWCTPPEIIKVFWWAFLVAMVGVASVAGVRGLPGAAAYSASKSAVIKLMESLRVDLHRCNVKVTTICPGFVDTPMIAGHPRRVLKFVLEPPEAARRIARAIERGRSEYWFPWPTWLAARVARALPLGLYVPLVSLLSERVYGDREVP